MADRETGDTVEIEFTLEADDVRALARWSILRRPKKLAALAAAATLVVGGCMVVGPSLFDPRDRSLVPQVVSGAVGVALCAAAFAGSIEAQVKAAGQIRGIGPRVVAIGPDGVRQTSPGVGETTRPWSAVEEVRAERIGLLLRVNAIQYLMIPRRAFADEAEFGRVADLVRAYAARSAPSGFEADPRS